MTQDTQKPSIKEDDNQQEDIKRLIFKYLRYWPWFIVGVLIALVLAFLYNRYTSNVYHTESEIKILKDKDSGLDLSGLQGSSPMFDFNEVNLENEIQILKSRKLLDSVVNSLELNTLYFVEGDINTSEVWKNNLPFMVDWKKVDSSQTKENPVFSIDFKSSAQFTVSVVDKGISKKATLNDPVEILNHRFIVSLNPLYERKFTDIEDSNYLFRHISEEKAIDNLYSKLIVEQVGEKSEILNIAYEGSNRHKNEAVLDTLIVQFNKDGVRDKQLISKRTGDFVGERLKLLVEELDTVESGLVDYKRSNDLVTIESSAEQLFGKEASAESERFKLQTQKEVTQDFRDQLINGEEYELLPANLGIKDSNVNKLTEAYNESVLMRNDLLTSSTSENPLVKNLETKLSKIKQNILKSVNGYISNLKISLQNFQEREGESSGKLSKIPEKEKEVRSIIRQREIKEKLYLFLLQKREEAALQYATTSPTIKVVDFAYTNPSPVAPKKRIIYLAALIFGFLVPFGILYLRFLFDTKISEKEQVKRILGDTPIFSEIPELTKNAPKLIVKNDRSVLAEAFRILRTNLSFFKSKELQESERGEIVFVTSTIKGEGKTFAALNMANTLASTGKKTLVIGCDLRNPQVHNYYGLTKNHIGVSNYLSDHSIELRDLLVADYKYFENLDVVLSGQIPPNPAELLMSDRFGELMAHAKANYDYVVVDTAPTILVTDTLLISHYADVTLYMVRSGVTESRLLDHIHDLYRTGKLKNMGVVLNSIQKKSGYGYGYSYNYGYGYGYKSTSYRWWKFWRSN